VKLTFDLIPCFIGAGEMNHPKSALFD